VQPTAQCIEQHQRADRKALVHFFNEWRVVSVQQKDLRVSAETIAHQWERELLLKKKVSFVHIVHRVMRQDSLLQRGAGVRI